MRTNILKLMCVSLLVLGLSLGGGIAFAEKEDSTPAGWDKGEKKGWQGGQVPPGLADKEKKTKEESNKSAKEAKKQKEKAEREAKKAQKKAERETKKNAKKLGR